MVQRKKTPVTRHRLFPVVVALWFAALLGLGSFAVPATMLSEAVSASGLPAVIPAAAPPLGFTARTLVALVLTATGALLGFVIGRRIGGRRAAAVPRQHTASPVPTVRARDSHPDAPPRRPFSASEHLPAPEPVEMADPPFSGRRRALAVTDETKPAEHRDIVPLPGSGEVMPLDLSTLFAEIESEGAARDEEALFAGPVVAEPVEQPFEEPVEVVAKVAAEPVPSLNEAVVPTSGPVAAPPVPVVVAAPVVAAVAPPPAVRAASPVAAAPLETLGVVQLVERLALAIGEHRQRYPESGAPEGFAEALRALGGTAPLPSKVSEPEPETPALPAAAPAAVAPRPAPAPAIARFEKAPVVTLPVTPAPWIPAADDDALELPAQAARFLRIETPAEASPVVPADAEDEILAAEDTAAGGYSSLLSVPVMRQPDTVEEGADEPSPPEPAEASGRQMFVRIDQPLEAPGAEPVVIFPGHAATPAGQQPGESPRQPLVSGQSSLDREEADRALRAALATLQRMSGAR